MLASILILGAYLGLIFMGALVGARLGTRLPRCLVAETGCGRPTPDTHTVNVGVTVAPIFADAGGGPTQAEVDQLGGIVDDLVPESVKAQERLDNHRDCINEQREALIETRRDVDAAFGRIRGLEAQLAGHDGKRLALVDVMGQLANLEDRLHVIETAGPDDVASPFLGQLVIYTTPTSTPAEYPAMVVRTPRDDEAVSDVDLFVFKPGSAFAWNVERGEAGEGDRWSPLPLV